MNAIIENQKLSNNQILNNINPNDSLDNTLNNMGLSEKTHYQYKYEMIQFLTINHISFDDLITTILETQHHIIKDGKIIEYDPQHSILKKYYDNYISECRNKNNKDSSIQTRINIINSILKQHGLKTPKIKFNINSQKKTHLLTSDDINYIINNHCNIHQKAIITFMASTGIRRADTLNFKIIDFLKATYKYHHTLNLDEFITKCDNNMVGYWEFTPQKTKKTDLICKVCNSGESSNYIIESLKQRLISIEDYNKKHDDKLELTIDDALFSNKYHHYKGHIQPAGFTNVISKKNKSFKQYKEKTIKEDLETNKISIHEYDKLMENIPVFKLHNLRHYFISILRQHTNNRDIALIMEAHTSDIKTDRFYIGESEEVFNEEVIRDTYKNVEKYLTFNSNISVKDSEQLKSDNKQLIKHNSDLKKENLLLKNMLEDLKTEQLGFKEQINNIASMLKNSPINELGRK